MHNEDIAVNKYINIIKQILELAETGLAGLEHIKLKLNEVNYEVTIPLLEDVLEALVSMENSLQLIASQLLPNQLNQLAQALHADFDEVISAYEQQDKATYSLLVVNRLLPNYKKWHAELDRVLMPYLLS
jgi:tRNA splicing ligase